MAPVRPGFRWRNSAHGQIAHVRQIHMRKRGGRKLAIRPDGVAAVPQPRARVDGALLKALARGFGWRKLPESGDCATVEDVASSDKNDPPYVSRVLRMTLLAPESVEAILAGRQPMRLTMAEAIRPFPVAWPEQ